MTRVIFWFGVKGAEAVRERRGWRRVQTGHFLCRTEELKGVARLLQSSGSMRRALRELEKDGFCEDLGAGLTLVGLGSEFPHLWKDSGVAGAEFLTLCAYLKRAEFVLPWRKSNQLGWLIVSPDEQTAAAWELALMCVHNVGGVMVCQHCGGLFRGKAGAKKCQSCKANKPKRKRRPTPRSRFLNLLAQDVKRGRLTDEERKEIKAILEERGLAAAEGVLQETLSGRGIR